MSWIIVRNWDRFQHYGDRQPPWIKLYVTLVHDDDFQSLTPTDRSALVALWMLYAMTRKRVRDDTAMLSRSTGQRITRGTLERLTKARFIEVSASPPPVENPTQVSADKPLKNARRNVHEPPKPTPEPPNHAGLKHTDASAPLALEVEVERDISSSKQEPEERASENGDAEPLDSTTLNELIQSYLATLKTP